VAGTFYPSEPGALRAEVDRLLGQVLKTGDGGVPRALIAPHAGYAYSGPVAATAFRRIAAAGGRLARVAVIGPSHYVAFRGIAVPRGAGAFRTPLGEVAVDREALAALARLPGVVAADAPHRREHAIEVELPFLQRVLGQDRFALVPLVVGDTTQEEVAAVLEPFANDPGTLVVVSSDLSHFLSYELAVWHDRATAAAIERLDGERLGLEDACGHLATRGWLVLARQRRLSVERLDLKNSGDTAGVRRSVVGYGAWAFGDKGIGGSPA
jgi:AmmeMemoRadiSam system protein B